MDTHIYSAQVAHSIINHCDIRGYNPDRIHIKDIFFDNYDTLVQWDESGKARPCILDNVQKAIICSSSYMGYDMFECPHCGNFNFVFHCCHGNLCQKCGAKRSQMLAASFSSIALDVPHRHIVFTIPEELRILFLKDRSLLNVLFIASRNTIAQTVNKNLFDKLRRKARKKGSVLHTGTYTFKDDPSANSFGMVATLHTFGRSLQWNPHIHALVPELIYNKSKDLIKKFDYFSYEKMRKTFQFEVLRLLGERIGPSFSYAKSLSYDRHYDGWYVYGKPMDDASDSDDDQNKVSKNIQACINYCLRYAGRTPMAESRIDSYDRDSGVIDWWYEDHKTCERVDVHESSISFLKKLIIHCPDPCFKTMRYYGFYANACKHSLDRVHELLGKKAAYKSSKSKRHQLKISLQNKLKYRTLLIDTYNRDPIKCSCGGYMEYIGTMDPFGRIVYDGYGGDDNDREYRNNCIIKMQQMRARRKNTRLAS